MSLSPRVFACLSLLGLVLATLPVSAVVLPEANRQDRQPDQIIVKFRDAAGIAKRDAQMLRLGVERAEAFGRGRNQLLRLAPGADLDQAIARLKASGLVEYAHPNHIKRKLAACSALVAPHVCPNDPNFSSQFHLHNPFVVAGPADSDADMDMPEAWDIISNAPNVLLAIIDDGFDLGHADLDANLRPGLTCNEANANCNGTAAAQAAGEDHGTYVAGSAAAVGNNGIGVTGVFMSGDVLPLRMPHYSTAEEIMAIDEAIAQGAKVINMSFGGTSFDQAEVDAIDRARNAGILVVASAGNEDSSIDKSVSNYPANYELDNVLSIAASDATDDLADFSNWGPMKADLAAAGDGIFTTERNGTVAVVDGTSFSSPITAGAATLIAQRLIDTGTPNPTYHELKALLFAGADNASDTGDIPLRGRVAAGRVNVRKSLQAIPLAGGVLVARDITFSDGTGVSAGNDGDGQPDPGETFDLNITLENSWQSAGTVDGLLSTTDGDATVTNANAVFPSVAAFGTSTAAFRVQLAGFTGNRQIRFRLDLTPQNGAAQTRYFYLEVGALTNGVEVAEPIQTNSWDEFHAWHASVPAGATNIMFETHTNNSIDIDLYGRRNTPPSYFADLPTHGTSQTCDSSDPCAASNGATGEELITTSASGLWHLVVINAAHIGHTYRIKASWDAAGAGTVRFAGPTSSVNESAGVVNVQVVRSGGVGAVSVQYGVSDRSAHDPGDFSPVSGVLNWANGDTSPKTISVPINDDGLAEGAETFVISIIAPTGGADIGRYSENVVTISDPMSGGGGGGGATDLLVAAALAALLAARRRRMP